jgi:hypothetical protein
MSREGSPRDEPVPSIKNSLVLIFISLSIVLVLADQPLSGMDAGSADSQGK